MERDEQVRSALFDQLRAHDAAPDNPINLLTIGPALVYAGYSQEEIVHALFFLEAEKRIELLPGNRVRPIKPLN